MTANPDFKPGDEPYLMISDGLGKEMPVMYLVEQRLHLQEWLLLAELLIFFFLYRPGYGVPVGLVSVLYVRMLVSVCCLHCTSRFCHCAVLLAMVCQSRIQLAMMCQLYYNLLLWCAGYVDSL